MPDIRRQAVRALLVSDPGDELLLVRLFVPDSGKRIWLAPGGGVEVGESNAAALQREVWEETGLKIRTPGTPVWRRSHSFVFRQEDIEQHELYYLLRVPHFVPHGTNNPAQNEVELIEDMRWWPLAEIQASDEIFVPRKLGLHLAQLLHQPLPAEPIEVGV